MERSRQPANLVLRTLATSNTLTMSSVPYACAVNSPVTNLTLNLSELNTGRATPRRKLSLSCIDTPNSSSNPTPERSISIESGCFVDTPSPIESPTFEMCAQKFSALPEDVQPEAGTKRMISFRKFNSMPLPMMRMSPTDLEGDHRVKNIQSTPLDTLGFGTCIASPTKKMDTSDETVTDISSDIHLSGGSSSSSDDSLKKKVSFFIDESSSQDSGFECDKDSRDAKDLDDGFEFAAPQGIPPSLRRHSKIICEDTCSPFKYSPVKEFSPSKRRNSNPIGSLDFSGEIVQPVDENCPDSPLKMCSLASVDEGIGEGFFDIMDEENIKPSSMGTSSAMSSLFTAPLINKKQHTSFEDEDTPVTRRVISRRYLQRSQSMNVRSLDERFGGKREKPDDCESPMQFTFKRNQPQDESTPRQEQKRMRSSLSMESPVAEKSRPVLHRCHSESEAMIKSALNRQADEPDLIGDCSKTYCLPTQTGKHQDLKCISSETMSRVIEGEFSDDIEKVYIVDCRYPYEFQGGHIQGADNIYTNDGIINTFLKNPIKPTDPNKRVILVFHCEFSSERGPRLSRFLRSQDRMANKECYPHLHYPELYLLEGGYKQFFQTEKENCVPQTYKPMLHPDHNEDLRKFRIKSKSWAGEQKSNRMGFRPLKF